LFAPQANAVQGTATPEYASPEQADTTGEIDETFDVYSLLAIRYELLIGAVLFDPARLRNVGLAEVLRISRSSYSYRNFERVHFTRPPAQGIHRGPGTAFRTSRAR